MTKLMKDVFELPVIVKYDNDTGLYDDYFIEYVLVKDSKGDKIFSDEQAEYMQLAINNHDTLTEQNKQLVEDNRELVDMLNKTYYSVRMAFKQGLLEDLNWTEYNNLLAKHKEQI